MSKINLFYNGLPGDGFGWGVANANLIRELSKLCCVHTPATFDDHKFTGDLFLKEHVVFTPLLDHDFNAPTLQLTKLGQRYNGGHVRGRRNFAYTFFESELGPNAAANAAKYDVVFCGSTWCLERMKERGITNGRVLIQGVDHEIFKPQPVQRNDNEFRIFSGGKFEYRKGQDIVIAAFRELWRKYPEMRLICAWHNPWPNLLQSMEQSPHITMVPPALDQYDWFQRLLAANGIDLSRVTVLPQLTQPELAHVMNQTDLGVFPNRCEGGTNLVMMEYMACGKPVVASTGTGHADICAATYPTCLEPRNNDSGWCESPVETVVGRVEEWVADPTARAEGGENCLNAMKQFTWERAARTILETVLEYQ